MIQTIQDGLPKQGVLVVPFVITMKASQYISSVANSFMVGLKSGYYHLINNFQVSVNGTSIVNQQSYLN